MFTLENGRRARANASVPAVLKAFRLLDILSESPDPLGVSELARRLEMGKSTVYGLVTTLQDVGAIEAADGAKRYRIGRGLTALAMRSMARQDVRSAARPHLERLAAQTEQTAFLGLVGTDSVTILDLVHGRPSMSVSAPVGAAIPLLAGAVGKAILAAWDPKRRARFIAHAELPRFTPQTITDRSAYSRAVDESERRGAALDVDEYVDGMRAAASGVVAPDGRLAAVIWVAGFARHIDDASLEKIADSVSHEARDLGRAL
jgi:IclR family KDG regulon transcriptional repressor